MSLLHFSKLPRLRNPGLTKPGLTKPSPALHAGSHHLEVQVGGETLMARLLRSTIGALNTSSEMVMETNNLRKFLSVFLVWRISAWPEVGNQDPRPPLFALFCPPPECLPEPRGMSRDEYVKCAIPLGALVVLCFLQVYVFRLRRVIAAFYFPKVGGN